MLRNATRRPGWQPSGGNDANDPHPNLASSATRSQVCLVAAKRGRDCCIAKLVVAHPLAELVLAMPYRNRQTVDHVSVPPSVLAYARRQGCQLWLVRLDADGRCLALQLADVERAGWLKPSDGSPEWFVPIATFRPIAWQCWEYVERTVRLDPDTAHGSGTGRTPTPTPSARQPSLFEVAS